MERETLLAQLARAKRQVEQNDLDIAAQNQLIINGCDIAAAQIRLQDLQRSQEAQHAEIERLLDALDSLPLFEDAPRF
jgi:hypothetical protein